jgi:hypothetical protein
LYFSCKNCQEKLWTCFTKVVVLFTRNPKKIRFAFFDFSTIFHGFSKILQNTYTIEDRFYTEVPRKDLEITYIPLLCRKNLGKIENLAMWPLAMGRWRACRIPAARSAGEECEEGLGSARG